MQVGKLRHRVKVQAKPTSLDDYGEDDGVFQDIGTRWASVEPLGGRELLAAQQVNAEAVIRIRMRYYAGLTTDHRIRHGENVYEIVSVADREMRHESMELMCKQAV